MGNRVVVTGIGLVTPHGPDRESSWRGLIAGRSAARRLAADELLPFGGRENRSPAWIGAPAVLPPAIDAIEVREPTLRIALAAAHEAMVDAGVGDNFDPLRAGCVLGTSKGGLQSFARGFEALRRGSPEAAPRDWLEFLPNAPAAAVAARFLLRGASLAPVAACATGLVCINRGAELVRDGHCDLVLAGSGDASLHPAVLASFQRLGVLAHDGEAPATACRPFDLHRSGFVVGEGGAVLVLERLESARARGQRIYAEWLGGTLLSDPSGLTALESDGQGLARLIGDLLERSAVAPAEIDHISLHGTATRQNDRVEARGLHQAFGTAIDGIPCSSLKGGIGHLLGAAGSVETAATLLAMRDGLIPPTVNLEDPDPECRLNCTPGTSRARPVRTALKLSLGFGGHLAAALWRTV